MKNKRISQMGFLLVILVFMSISSKFPLHIDNKYLYELKEPSSSAVLSPDFLQTLGEFTLNRSEFEQIRDIELFDLDNNGRKEIIIISTVWNSSGDTDRKGLLQVYDFHSHKISLLDSLILTNTSNNLELFEINLHDLDGDSTKEIVITGGITNTGWAFLNSYNFTLGSIQLELTSWWDASYFTDLTVAANDMIFADFDNDAIKEVCTLTSTREDFDNHQNLIRFWTVNDNKLILEYQAQFQTNNLELFWQFDDNFWAYDIDKDNTPEILICGAYNSIGSDDKAKLWALNYTGSVINEEAYTYWDYGNAGGGSHGLRLGDFDADKEDEILIKFTWRDTAGDKCHRARFFILNYSGNQFNTEYGQDYWSAIYGSNQLIGDWIPMNFDADNKTEFISTDFFPNNRRIYLRIWNYSGEALIQTETDLFSSDCTSEPPLIRFFDNSSPFILTYPKYDTTGYNLHFKILGYDEFSPNIVINSPKEDEPFGSTAPSFDISIFEPNLNETWYTLDNGATNITFSGETGSINQTEWDKKADEQVTIIFYANDTLGKMGSAEVSINKDLSPPIIIINSPAENDYYGSVAPNYDLQILESNLEDTWYTIDCGVTNISFSGETGSINQTEWDKKADEQVTIIFYANDALGNEASAEVNVTKLTTGPQITIIFPTPNYIFGRVAPKLELSIIGPSIDTTWYTLDNGLKNITFNGEQCLIDQTEWNKFESETVSIKCYVNDTDGIIASVGRTVLKDNYLPQVVYNQTWGGIKSDIAYGVGIDSSDNVYITGENKKAFPIYSDMFIVKYDNNSIMQWNRTWGGDSSEIGHSIAFDSSDNVYIVGETYSFGSGDPDIFLVKYDSSGTLLLNLTKDGIFSNEDMGYDIHFDSSGNIYIVGVSYVDPIKGYEAILLKYNSEGVYQWNRTWGGNNTEFANGFVIDYVMGDFYITGTTSSGWGLDDMFLTKYDYNGNFQWTRTWGGSGMDIGEDIIMDLDGNIYIVGYTNSFGEGSIDMFLVKYNSYGDIQWNLTWGGPSMDQGFGISFDNYHANEIYITGLTESFGMGIRNGFIAKFDSMGIQLWNLTWGGPLGDEFWDLAFDSSENLFCVGKTYNYGVNPGVSSDAVLVKFSTYEIEIGIILPIQNAFFGTTPPDFEIFYKVSLLAYTWYNLNGGSIKIFNGVNGTINQDLWDAVENGSIIIKFKIVDFGSHGAQDTVRVFKDTYAPISSISYNPYHEINTVNKTTTFSLIANDGRGSGVSLIRYQIDDLGWIKYTGLFDLSSYEYGNHTISFYSIDNVGNIETVNVISVELVALPSKRSSTIPGYNLIMIIGFVSIISIILLKKFIQKYKIK